MLRLTSALVILAISTGCGGTAVDFGDPQSTEPTAEFDILAPDVDENRPVDPCTDADGDGWGDGCSLGIDCDDTDPDVNGSVIEIEYDGIDNDCKVGTRDDDIDKDGFCTLAGDPDCPATDCDDTNADINPDMAEVCNNSIDENCNGGDDDTQEDGIATCPWDLVAPNCADVLSANAAQQDVDGYYKLNSGVHWCDMTTLGGGFTLVMVSADDGVDSFTFDAAAILGDDATIIGTPGSLNADYRSKTWNSIKVSDLLFVHEPSGVWAAYENTGDVLYPDDGDDTTTEGNGVKSLGDIIEDISATDVMTTDDPPVLVPPELVCDDPEATPYPLAGVPMTAGDLAVGTDGGTNGYQLCSTDLYFNRGDHEVNLTTCESPTTATDQGTFGPVWNATKLDVGGCDTTAFVNPALAGVGPDVADGAVETPAAGWGWVTETNTGDADSGANALKIFVR